MDSHLFERCYAALMYDEEKEYEDAIRSLTDHLAANPSNAAAFNNRAVAFWAIGQTERALADFAEAIRLAPTDSQPAIHRGVLLQKIGDLPGALADFDAAVLVAPDDPFLRRTRGHARMAAGEFVGAAEDYCRAIALQPEFRQTYLDRAAVYERQRLHALAEQDHQAAARLTNNRV